MNNNINNNNNNTNDSNLKKDGYGLFNGLMEKNIENTGKMGNKMGKENFILSRSMYGENDLFKMEKELNG